MDWPCYPAAWPVSLPFSVCVGLPLTRTPLGGTIVTVPCADVFFALLTVYVKVSHYSTAGAKQQSSQSGCSRACHRCHRARRGLPFRTVLRRWPESCRAGGSSTRLRPLMSN